jgi:hypothetical protein
MERIACEVLVSLSINPSHVFILDHDKTTFEEKMEGGFLHLITKLQSLHVAQFIHPLFLEPIHRLQSILDNQLSDFFSFRPCPKLSNQ